MAKGYNKFTYEEAKEHTTNINFKPNHILFTVPSDVIVFDTDSEKSYNKLVKCLQANDVYKEENITRSFSGIMLDHPYKRHLYFKCLPSETRRNI